MLIISMYDIHTTKKSFKQDKTTEDVCKTYYYCEQGTNNEIGY